MKMKDNKTLLFLLLVTAVVWLLVFQKIGDKGKLNIYFLNVGQGDAIYFRTPKGKDILIDGGRRGAVVLEKLGKVMKLGDRTIDLVVATHMDADHIGGLKAVLKYYKVKEIWSNGLSKNTEVSRSFEDSVENEIKEGASFKTVSKGQRERFGLVSLLVLSGADGADLSQNNSSVVVKVRYRKFSALLTGDAEFELENKILRNRRFNLKADVLKVAHHGSSGSTSENFLKAVGPKMAIISVGKNSYGHPSERVLNLLKRYKIVTFRTDRIGTIHLSSNGFYVNCLRCGGSK